MAGKTLTGPDRCRRRFLRSFPGGFRDETYIDWERGYKWQAHLAWEEMLSESEIASLVRRRDYGEIARRAVVIESRTNLLFSFEKMALRDAVKTGDGAKRFSLGLQRFLVSDAPHEERFEEWCHVVASLPRKQTRVLTWPVVTVFGFIATPAREIFLKPNVTRRAAGEYGYDFDYRSRPNWETYRSLLDFAAIVRRDLRDLRPRDLIDIQSFLWVQGSDEYD